MICGFFLIGLLLLGACASATDAFFQPLPTPVHLTEPSAQGNAGEPDDGVKIQNITAALDFWNTRLSWGLSQEEIVLYGDSSRAVILSNLTQSEETWFHVRNITAFDENLGRLIGLDDDQIAQFIIEDKKQLLQNRRHYHQDTSSILGKLQGTPPITREILTSPLPPRSQSAPFAAGKLYYLYIFVDFATPSSDGPWTQAHIEDALSDAMMGVGKITSEAPSAAQVTHNGSWARVTVTGQNIGVHDPSAWGTNGWMERAAQQFGYGNNNPDGRYTENLTKHYKDVSGADSVMLVYFTHDDLGGTAIGPDQGYADRIALSYWGDGGSWRFNSEPGSYEHEAVHAYGALDEWGGNGVSCNFYPSGLAVSPMHEMYNNSNYYTCPLATKRGVMWYCYESDPHWFEVSDSAANFIGWGDYDYDGLLDPLDSDPYHAPLPVISRFTATPGSGSVPLIVTFTDASANTPTSWNWSFGDGTFSTVQNPVHTYDYPGTFTVALNATNAARSNVSVQTNYVSVWIPRPIPAFSMNVSTGRVPLSIAFSDQSAGTPDGWAWYFGDEDFSAPWTQVNASFPWSVRDGNSFVVMPDGSIIMTGGLEVTGYLNDTWRSTDEGATWTLINASSGWSGRRDHSSVAMPDGSIILMGGELDALPNIYSNEVWRSSDNGRTWTLVTASAEWSPRYLHKSIAMPDHSIVLIGGWNGKTYTPQVWRSTDSGATWLLQTGSAGWSTRYQTDIVVTPDGSLHLMGGGNGGGYNNDTWISSDNGVSWTRQTAAAEWSARGHHTSAALPDGSIILMGGFDGHGYKNDTWRSTDNGSSWTQVSGAGWSGRVDPDSLVLRDGSILVTGGYDKYFRLTDTWRFQPAGSSAENPSHTYTKAGTFKVSLQVFNSMNSNSTQRDGAVTVTPALPPVVTAVTPATAFLNTTINFTVTGTNYDATGSMTMVNFTRGAFENLNVTLSSVTTTKIDGTMTIGPDAPAGPWDLTVTTANGGTSPVKTGALTVSKNIPPAISAITPTTGAKNTTVNYTITGNNFQTGSGQTRVRVYEDVMDSEIAASFISITPTTIAGSLDISPDAIPGSYMLEVNTVDGGTATKPAAFQVVHAAIPTIAGIAPSSGYRNDTIEYTITGTNFQPGLTTVTFRNQSTGTALGVSEVSSVTGTKITGSLTVPATSPTGYYRLDIIAADGGVVNRLNAFRIDAVNPPVISSLTPTTGAKGSTTAFTLTGSNFMSAERTSVLLVDDVSGTAVLADKMSTLPTKIIGSFTIPATAPPGKYRLELSTTDGGTAKRNDAFTVNYRSLPVISSITPSFGARNTNVSFTLKGDNFADGGTIVRLRTPGTTINSSALSVNTTLITGNFPIPAAAATGSYRLDVFTLDGGFNSRINAFVVT